MRDTTPGAGLSTIFAIFLGLMVTAFVGVGVYTFYPSPDSRSNDRLTRLNRDELRIRNAKDPNALTADDRARLQAIADERDVVQDADREAREAWGRRTSIVLVIVATLAMAVSLVRAVQLPVISNGLLLGGVFTMLYGVGWILVTDTSTSRFVVMTVALVVTLGLGYLRFVRGGPVPVASPADATVTSVGGTVPGAFDVLALERRVRDVEQRLDEAAGALRKRD